MSFFGYSIISIFLTFYFVNSYRLNVPRVLLPFHLDIQVQFLLEVSHPGGGCFKWFANIKKNIILKLLKF